MGWVRGDVETSTEALKELNVLRKQLREMEERQEAIRRRPPPGSEEFAQGEDRTDFFVEYYWRGDVKDSEGTTHTYLTETGVLEPITHWDQFFYVIGPLLLDEANELALRKAINDWLTEYFYTETIEDLEGRFGSEVAIARTRERTASLPTQEFGTLIVQLRALGLIQKSERKHAVSDKSTYWCLTPFGDEHLTALRAIRKSDLSDDAPADDNGNDGSG